jgi:hypothetical protein
MNYFILIMNIVHGEHDQCKEELRLFKEMLSVE